MNEEICLKQKNKETEGVDKQDSMRNKLSGDIEEHDLRVKPPLAAPGWDYYYK